MARLERDFFHLPTLELTERLLGKIFVRKLPDGTLLKGRIVETEAYLGTGDEACHAWRGMTERNRVMFASPGTLYVYFTYGCHHLMNVVSEPEGTAGAVLIRAMEPLEGIEEMQRRRGQAPPTGLLNGPAKLTRALGIDTAASGRELFSGEFGIEDAPDLPDTMIGTSTRVGISRSTELPWRKFVLESPHLSKGRPS